LYFFEGRYDLALEEFRRRYELDPEHPSWQTWYAVSLAYNNQIEEAFALIDQSARATPDNTYTKFGLLQLDGLRGDGEAVRNALTGDFRAWCKERLWSTRVAAAFALLNEREEALAWLEHAVNSGFINYPLLAECDPWLENIRGEERFKKLMVRVKRQWEEFEV
jgi:tetratricopeptide (TPR) repeat protein